MSFLSYSWLLLAASVAAEVAGTIALRYADGFTRIIPSGLVAAFYALAIWLMSIAIRQLEVGMAYAVWAGFGVALTAVIGIFWFNESATTMKMAGIALVVLGVVVLNLDSGLS